MKFIRVTNQNKNKNVGLKFKLNRASEKVMRAKRKILNFKIFGLRSREREREKESKREKKTKEKVKYQWKQRKI